MAQIAFGRQCRELARPDRKFSHPPHERDVVGERRPWGHFAHRSPNGKARLVASQRSRVINPPGETRVDLDQIEAVGDLVANEFALAGPDPFDRVQEPGKVGLEAWLLDAHGAPGASSLASHELFDGQRGKRGVRAPQTTLVA